MALNGSALAGIGLADIKVDDAGNVTVNGNADGSLPDDMALIKASDSEILLNGAKMTSSSSTVSVNGLSIELTGLTKQGNHLRSLYQVIPMRYITRLRISLRSTML